MKRFATTKKHFDVFQKHVAATVVFFGLHQFDVRVLHEKIDGRAACQMMCLHGVAVVRLNTVWDVPVTDELLRSTAQHEVCHVLLGNLHELAYQRHCTGDDIYRAEEECANLLVNAIFVKRATK